jgi:hypothetical protein
MTSNDTRPDATGPEGQDHEDTMAGWLGMIRFLRVMRLVCVLAVPVVAAMGLVSIVQSGGDPAEVGIAIGGTAAMACFSYFAGRQATRLQTKYGEATAPSTN